MRIAPAVPYALRDVGPRGLLGFEGKNALQLGVSLGASPWCDLRELLQQVRQRAALIDGQAGKDLGLDL
ncbi:MAG: hypothetical protein ACYDDZ_15240, partial [Acidimicrobiales bacterium]